MARPDLGNEFMSYEEMAKIRQQRGLPDLPPPKLTAEEPIDVSTLRYLNESAIYDHALRCSKAYRAGRFTRVGQDFLDEVKADVEAMIRDLRGKFPTFHESLEPAENTSCVSGLLSDKLAAEFNRAICRLIQNKVQRQPSCGKTLGRTR